MNKTIRAIIFGGLLVVGMAGLGAAYSPSMDVVHEYDDHTQTLVDVEYHPQFDIVFSLDEGGTFMAYQIQNEEAQQITQFDAGHAMAIGDGVVYVAARDTLWEYDLAAGELTEVTKLPVHPAAIDYDAVRNLVWVGGDGTVYGYNATSGAKYMNYTVHSEGIETLHAKGDYVATGTTWTNEAVVYDVKADEVAFEPALPDDVKQVGAVHITDGDGLIVGTDAEDGSLVAAYDIVEQERLVAYRQHVFAVSAVDYIEEHDVIVSMGFDNTIKFFDVEASEVAAVYEHPDTVYTGDLDTRNDILWFGDGEERSGTVTGIDVSYEEPTPTQTPTPEPTPTPDAERTSTPEVTPTATSAGGPGFGVAVALVALLAVALRRRE